jgi:hypothetical protein
MVEPEHRGPVFDGVQIGRTELRDEHVVVIHTDGGCRPNPGPGGWGAVLSRREHVRERTDALPACRQRAISSATAEYNSDGGVPRATRVATRRNAACCSASTLSSSRLACNSARVAALAIAVATRSAKSPMRASVSAGSGSGADEPTIAAPHTDPSTMIGNL